MLEYNLLRNDVYSWPAVKQITHSWLLQVIALTIIPHLQDRLFIVRYRARAKYPLSMAYLQADRLLTDRATTAFMEKELPLSSVACYIEKSLPQMTMLTL